MSIDAIASSVLESLAGPGAVLRPDQRQAVEALTEPGARVVVVQATGWGKSAVYWVATAIARSRGQGTTLVISPLLSLMRDQVSAAQRAGLRAATINSSNSGDWELIESQLLAGELDVLLVSPERLANPTFGKRVLGALAGNIGLLVIDEAHALSDWGHDFRPDYRRVADVLRTMNPRTPVLATTATANERVTRDLAAQLGEKSLVLRGPLARNSLQLNVLGSMSLLERYAWVVDHLPQLPGSGIVYALTVADAQRLAEVLKEAHGDALPVAAYTGQLDADERSRLEDALKRNEVKALVATSALGMGYDKPDLGFVVHLGAPASPVSYYQQIGRAGRAIDHALVALLPAASDEDIWAHFATATIPKRTEVKQLLGALAGSHEPMSVPALEAETGIRRSRVELLLKQLAVDGATERTPDGWVATGAQWEYDEAHYASIIETREREADIMRAYIAGSECLMALLRRSLDDPDPQPCGRCSVCQGRLADGLAGKPTPESVVGTRNVLRADAQELAPRKMWPGGAFGVRGKIPAELAAEPGRVLIHANAPEWEAEIAAPEAPTPELNDAAVKALAAWSGSWDRRPTCVISVPTDPQRTSSRAEAVGAHLAAVGRLPHATWPGQPPAVDGMSGDAVAADWRDAFAADGFPDVLGASVLLAIDSSATTWEPTVAAATLREQGATHVLPLLIHRVIG